MMPLRRATERSQLSRTRKNAPPRPLGRARSTTSTPMADGRSCQLPWRNHVPPRENSAPIRPPVNEPRPPTTVDVNTAKLGAGAVLGRA